MRSEIACAVTNSLSFDRSEISELTCSLLVCVLACTSVLICAYCVFLIAVTEMKLGLEYMFL